MAKKDASSSSTIWRTVVFAGAMLGTPTLVAAQGAPPPPPSKAPPTSPTTKPAVTPGAPLPPKPDPVTGRQQQIKTLDAERTALLAKLAETDPAQIDQLNKEIVAKDAAIKRLVTELVNLRKPRPRTPAIRKPVGRGFVLA